MEDLMIHGLQNIDYAEQQIIRSLPKMIDKATNRDLVASLKGHLEETNKQVERLQKVFESSAGSPAGRNVRPSPASSRRPTRPPVRSTTRRCSTRPSWRTPRRSNTICYGSLTPWAEELGHDDIVRFLTTNLNEEKATNTKLNTVAVRKGVNAKASTAA
jgi:ferritin-like metal-binding protein YciE